ncbi:transposase [Roseomonas mucosa]|uniref:transposase n=1 Tax=Roseomonas mucosa TaxID=207340 RepID=UPI0036F437B5
MTTKIHAATDALGNTVRLLFGPGQQGDMAQAHALIERIAPGAVIADRGYDADHLHDAILDAGAERVIPPRRHRRQPHRYDTVLYKERNASSASSTASGSSAASSPATTSSSPTFAASSNSPPSPSSSPEFVTTA